MVNYQLGKIYRIVCNTTGLTYVGSTCEPTLARRLQYHKAHYNTFLKGGRKNITSFDVLKNANYEIILIELCPCDSKDELYKRERFYIETMECVNIRIPSRNTNEINKEITKQKREIKKEIKEAQIIFKKEVKAQQREVNKEESKQKAKAYRESNKEVIAQRQKQYYENKKEGLKQNVRDYYEINKETILQKGKAYRETNKKQISQRKKEYYKDYKERKQQNNIT
jgi:hypothetical protein